MFVSGMQDIQGFREKFRKILVILVDSDSAIVAAGPPFLGRSDLGQVFSPNREGQIHSKTFDGIPMIVKLASSFGCLTLNSRGKVTNDDGRFGFVAVLTTGAAATFMPDFTVAQQEFCGNRGGMRFVPLR